MPRDLSTANESLSSANGLRFLIVRLGALLCALRIEHVVETMRPRPVRAVAGAPDYVLGLSVIRGEPMAVIDLAILLSRPMEKPSRFVVIRSGERRLALAVEAVVGVQSAMAETFGDLPPLLSKAAAGAITSVGTLDRELLLVLHTALLIPEAIWSRLALEKT